MILITAGMILMNKHNFIYEKEFLHVINWFFTYWEVRHGKDHHLHRLKDQAAERLCSGYSDFYSAQNCQEFSLRPSGC